MEALAQARQRQAETKQRCQEAAEAETIYSGLIKDTLEEAEALQKHVKTVTMRAESLATTEADFFTLLDRQEETQQHKNELSSQLCQTRSTQ